jgi:hypothetical protein
MPGNTTNPSNYELDLYTNGQCGGCEDPGGYGYDETLTITAPDGTGDWNNYTLATAGNPASTILFALDTATGALYECTSPGALTISKSGGYKKCEVRAGRWPGVFSVLLVAHVAGAVHHELPQCREL